MPTSAASRNDERRRASPARLPRAASMPLAVAACLGTSAVAASPASGYTVQPGDTVSHIAARTGTTVEELRVANGLDARALIRVGQELTIPGQAPAAAAPQAAAAPRAATHTVVAGDTVSGIAARTGTTVAGIVAANGLDSRALIRVGQVLRLPAPSGPMPTTFAGRTYPDAVVQAAQANRDLLAARDVPSREAMQRLIADTARQWGVDPALAQAVAYQESGFTMRAVSPANAVGAMQVIPSSGRWAAELSGQPIDLLDARDNALAGVVILRALTRAEADLPTAIAGYYQGLSSVRRNGMYDDTRRYVANVQTLMTRFGRP